MDKQRLSSKNETLPEKVARVIAESVEVVPYNPAWPMVFAAERAHLLECLPSGLILRIEHFGSTSVPGLAAKPIVDMLVEVSSLEDTKQLAAPVLEAQGYDYFWRPTFGDDGPPWYAWFIKRDSHGLRTHHIHMVENSPEFAGHWDRLLFRDYLRTHPEAAREYAGLKQKLATEFPGDRVEYTRRKGGFIGEIMAILLPKQRI